MSDLTESGRQTEHTSIPWKAVKVNDMFDPLQKGWGIIATEPMRGRVDSALIGMSEADARLCAAAPEMLFALKYWLLGASNYPEFNAYTLDQLIQQAIAKAEGRI